ncbi:MAG: hypothetical protein IPL32_18455 [Chloracidobacterium sp.]|nr:hypothetical protein [Chloracidobacterium sp.]
MDGDDGVTDADYARWHRWSTDNASAFAASEEEFFAELKSRRDNQGGQALQKIEIGKTELRALRAMLKKFTPAMDDPKLRAALVQLERRLALAD